MYYAGEGWSGAEETANDASLVLGVEWGETKVLLMGDAGPAVQQLLLDGGAVQRCTVLKVPHHGAANSLSDRFMEVVSPRAAIVSVGLENRFGHPSPDTLALLERVDVYRTDLDGSVEIAIGPTGYRLNPER